MKVEKVISNAMKKVDPNYFLEGEAEELEGLKGYEMTDPELSEKLSKILIREIGRE